MAVFQFKFDMNEFEKANRESIGTNYIFLLQNFKQNVECVENSTHLDANTKKKRKTHWLGCDMSPFFFGYLEGMLENSKFSLGRGSLTIFMKNIDLCSKNKNNRFEKDFDRRKVLFRKRNGIFSQIRVFLRCQPTRWAEKMQQFFYETNSIFMCRIWRRTFRSYALYRPMLLFFAFFFLQWYCLPLFLILDLKSRSKIVNFFIFLEKLMASFIHIFSKI